MSIRRFIADLDSTITNAFKADLRTRATASNMGASDILESFYIYGQNEASNSSEISRILTRFPVQDIVSDRAAKEIGNSGSVSFYLKLSNAPHQETTPQSYDMVILPLSKSWTEGHGLDMETYLDSESVNWVSASLNSPWTNQGADVYDSPVFTASFSSGEEDLQVNITPLVEQWIDGTKPNYGVLVKMSPSYETGSVSYYTKKFFARGSEFFYKRPWIEARTDSSLRDRRNKFVISSSLLSSQDNLNTIVLYNIYNGAYQNIPSIGTGSLYVSMYSGTVDGPVGSPLILVGGQTSATASYYSTGIYTASVGLTGNLDYVFDVWHNGAGLQFSTGSAIELLPYSASFSYGLPKYVTNIINLKPSYNREERERFRLFVRDKNWNPTIYSIAASEIENISLDNLYYKMYRMSDKYEVIPFGTGSDNHTRLSYDKDGNYFDFDFSLLESDYGYGIKFGFKNDSKFYELKEEYHFRVER